MAWSKNVTIWCDGRIPDGGECFAFYEAGGVPWVDQARADAQSEGWVRRGRRDLCPDHANEGNDE